MTNRIGSERGGGEAVLFCPVKNEAPFLVEWIAYHLAIGFDNIVICSNPSIDGSEELLDALAASGKVTHLRADPAPGQSAHEAAVQAFERAIGYKVGNWYIWLDADEFLNIHVGDNTVQALIARLLNYSGLLVNWRIFGSGGHKEFPGRFVDESFTLAARSDRVVNLQVKTFFQYSDGVVGFSPKFSHRPLLKEGSSQTWLRFLSGSGNELLIESERNQSWLSGEKGSAAHICERAEFGWALAQINHYAVRTPDLFMLKQLRGNAFVPRGKSEKTARYSTTFFRRYDRNDELDTSILRLKQQTDLHIEELSRLPGVSSAIGRARELTDRCLIDARAMFYQKTAAKIKQSQEHSSSEKGDALINPVAPEHAMPLPTESTAETLRTDHKDNSMPAPVFLTPVCQVARTEIWGQTIFFTISSPTDVIQGIHAQGRFYEPEELEIIRAFMEPASIFCDIGANVGNHTLFALKYLRARRSIVFEPNPLVLPTLVSNIELNGLTSQCDLRFLGYGLSDRSASGLQMVVNRRRNLGGARIVPVETGGTLQVLRGDDALDGAEVNFLKIDVEGMEMKVLGGLSETIGRWRPRIFVEVDNANAEEFGAWLDLVGYRVKARYRRYRANENFLVISKRAR